MNWGVNWYYKHGEYVARDNISTPSFVFGYGLSYTDFKYDNFEYTFDNEKNVAEISFDITNTGEYDGWEVAQCYVTDIVASVSRPVKELKAFEKAYIRKGQTQNIKFKLAKDDLSFYDLRGNWIFESGDFVIQIGKSSNDICIEFKQYINFA